MGAIGEKLRYKCPIKLIELWKWPFSDQRMEALVDRKLGNEHKSVRGKATVVITQRIVDMDNPREDSDGAEMKGLGSRAELVRLSTRE